MKKIKTRKSRLKRWGFFKLLMVLVFGGIVFWGSKGNVDAGMNDTTIVKNRIDGMYAIAEINGETRIFYMNTYFMDGILAYCIELGVDITSSRYHSTSDFSISYLSDEQIEYVRSITYFGYGYKGHDEYLYYAAAQEIIWEYITGIDVYWTSELNADGERVDIESYKNNILSLVEDYNKKIDLDFEDGQVYTVGDEIVIEDKNSILSDYEVVSSLYSDVSIEGNSLVIKVGNEIGKEKIELRRKGYYGYNSLLYYYDSSQKLISTGNYREVDEVVSFDISGVTLKGRVLEGKVDGLTSMQDSLEGAVYEVYSEDGDLIGTYKSDIKGTFEVSGLKYGKYYFKHLEASKGYLVSDEIIEVMVDSDNMEVILEQQLIANTIEINKVYGSEGVYSPESGIIFLVYDNHNIYFTKFVTGKDGTARVILPYGKYKVVQQNTTTGYSKVDDFFIEVLEQSEDKVYYNLINELILVKVRVNTFLNGGDDLLVSNVIGYKIREANKNSYLEFNGQDIFYADNNGVVSLPVKLDYGNYILEQVNVPDGVLLYEDDISFSINSRSKLELDDGDLVIDVDVYNDLIKGKVNIKTLKEVYYKDFNEYGYKTEIRSNVELLLKANADIVINDEVKYRAGEEIYRGKTNDTGELIIDDLYLGSYCLIDNDTLEERCFSIESIDNKTSIVNVDLEFVKYLDKFNLIINNKSNEDEVIVGSVFEIIDSEEEVIYTGITNEDGVVKVENILLGDYCVTQKKVLDGYYLLEDKVCFLLEGDKTLELVNEKVVNKTINVPDTFKNDDIGIYELLVIIAMIGTGYIVYKKIFNSKLYR